MNLDRAHASGCLDEVDQAEAVQEIYRIHGQVAKEVVSAKAWERVPRGLE